MMGKYYSIPPGARAKRKARTVTCLWCKAEFTTSAGHAKYCAEECAARGRLMKLSQSFARRAGGNNR